MSDSNDVYINIQHDFNLNRANKKCVFAKNNSFGDYTIYIDAHATPRASDVTGSLTIRARAGVGVHKGQLIDSMTLQSPD